MTAALFTATLRHHIALTQLEAAKQIGGLVPFLEQQAIRPLLHFSSNVYFLLAQHHSRKQFLAVNQATLKISPQVL